MKNLCGILLGICFTIAGTNAVDYCSVTICPSKNHVACNNTGTFSSTCPPVHNIVAMTNELKALLLQKHNNARMDIANGKIAGFSQADRMIEMSWDDELASFAEMNVKTCKMEHDKCMNTAVFKYAGQNLGLRYWTDPTSQNITTDVSVIFSLWFNEYVNCNMTQIAKLSSTKSADGKTFGHFTQVVMANSAKLGCAVSSYGDTGYRSGLLACNYAQTNMITWPVYTTGEPCSGCKSGCSATYPGLCNASEVV
ncbi:antigen 5 like allergen Cul n 1-like [Bradysia coprophila]|uniref:antigen 5 like allergen Cul n 1-like n=1 Tax=Bradysia coprophila TaxID=38358 RepID=UPI00187DD5F5|nr:antigen 5 like allergen Cul n 1-like [Bradysia coprophila]